MISLLLSLTIFSLFYLAPLVATGVVAHKKNRQWIFWAVLALFFPILALITVAILAPVVPCKRCAQCNRFSRASTLNCPFCNVPMPEGPIEEAADPAASNKTVIAVIVAILVAMAGVAVIGMLAAIAIPQFAALQSRAQEANTRAGLSSLRTALLMYHGETNGRYPKSLAELTAGGKYIQEIPKAAIPHSLNGPGHATSTSIVYGALKGGAGLTDAGGWFYDKTTGQVLVNCTHSDVKGKRWDSY